MDTKIELILSKFTPEEKEEILKGLTKQKDEVIDNEIKEWAKGNQNTGNQ